ncbi:TetR/AcrR family transcriptional regulator [Desulfosporosinus burensis]
MEYIAKEAGIGKGTIYEYFESKERLFEEILKFSIQEFRIGLKENMEQGETIEERLQNCSRYHYEFLNSHMDIVQIVMQVNTLSKEIRGQLFAEHMAILKQYTEMVQAAKLNGEIRADLDEELATYCIVGALDLFSKKRVLMDHRPQDEFDHHAIVDVVLKGLQ